VASGGGFSIPVYLGTYPPRYIGEWSCMRLLVVRGIPSIGSSPDARRTRRCRTTYQINSRGWTGCMRGSRSFETEPDAFNDKLRRGYMNATAVVWDVHVICANCNVTACIYNVTPCHARDSLFLPLSLPALVLLCGFLILSVTV
jgi:hypothetical protein